MTDDLISTTDHAAFDLQPPRVAGEPNVVVAALVAEFKRVRTKLNGANQRLGFANSQVLAESQLLSEYQMNLNLLADAILSSGGDLPGDEPTQ